MACSIFREVVYYYCLTNTNSCFGGTRQFRHAWASRSRLEQLDNEQGNVLGNR